MKRIFLVFVFFTILSISVSAQYKPFQFGLNIAPGVNITKINCDNVNSGDPKLSFNWGFTGNFYFVENYGFSTGFNVRNIRGCYDFTDSISGNINRSIENQYLEIPLGLMMRTEKIGKARIFGNIGYGLGICLNSNQNNYDINNTTVEFPDEFSNVRHALIIKLGIEYNIYKSSCITAAFVFNNNFANIYKKDNSLEHNIMLNNLCLEIGFMF